MDSLVTFSKEEPKFEEVVFPTLVLMNLSGGVGNLKPLMDPFPI